MEKQLVLSVKNLTKNFGDNQVLKGIDLDVYERDVVAIIGPSGCGKSTFLRTLNLLESIDSGEIIFENNNEYVVMFNPEIIKKQDVFETEESCLSLQGYPKKTKRYKYEKEFILE